MRSATCACVKPRLERIFKIESNIGISSRSKRSTRARAELGMVKPNELFIQIVQGKPQMPPTK
ncbi:MAG: hypothetical protein RIR79_1915 [Pseudomonadota bacterium]